MSGVYVDPYIPWVLDAEGNRRYLAALPTPQDELEKTPLFASNNDIFPKSEWKDFGRNFQQFLQVCQDQQHRSSCTGHALAGMAETFNAMLGATPRRFHGGWPYSFCNGGRDAGANCGQVIAAAKIHGFAEYSMAHPLAIFQRDFKPEAKENARRCRIGDYYRVRTFEEVGSALFKGFFVYFGTLIGNNFNPNSEGILPSYRGGSGGHAMYFLPAPMFKYNRWYFPLRNSWGARWGLNGIAYADASFIDGQRDYFEGYAVRLITTDTQETLVPPMAK